MFSPAIWFTFVPSNQLNIKNENSISQSRQQGFRRSRLAEIPSHFQLRKLLQSGKNEFRGAESFE